MFKNIAQLTDRRFDFMITTKTFWSDDSVQYIRINVSEDKIEFENPRRNA